MWGDNTVLVYSPWHGHHPTEIAASVAHSAILSNSDPPYLQRHDNTHNFFFICEMVPGKYTRQWVIIA